MDMVFSLEPPVHTLIVFSRPTSFRCMCIAVLPRPARDQFVYFALTTTAALHVVPRDRLYGRPVGRSLYTFFGYTQCHRNNLVLVEDIG
jgi:hypothetical protein